MGRSQSMTMGRTLYDGDVANVYDICIGAPLVYLWYVDVLRADLRIRRRKYLV
jgi:hypothetical protein